MGNKRALALGTYEGAKYHPFTGGDKIVEGVLADDIAVDSTDDYGVLNKKTLGGYDLFISYTEFDDTRLPDEAAAALVSFVAGGGGLLAIHNGISITIRRCWRNMSTAGSSGLLPGRMDSGSAKSSI